MEPQSKVKHRYGDLPETIECDEEYRCPYTGGVSYCEPRLIGAGLTGLVEVVTATYSHQCGKGDETINVDELFDTEC